MAFNPQEVEIIKYGKLNGKTRAQVEEALTNYRTGVTPEKAAPVEEKGGLQKIQEGLSRDVLGTPQRILDAGVNSFSEANKIASESKAQGENPVVGVMKTSGAIGRGLTSAIFEAIKGIPFVKPFLEGATPVVGKAIEVGGDVAGGTLNATGQLPGFKQLGEELHQLEQTNPGTARTVIDVLESFKNPATKIGVELAELEQSNPTAARFIEDVLEVSQSAGDIASAALLAEGVRSTAVKAGGAVKDATKRLIDRSTEIVKSNLPTLEAGKDKLGNLISPEKDLKGATGEVLQGKTKDIAKGIDTIKNVDTEGVKTFKELQGRITKRIGELSDEVDDVLRQDTTLTKLDDLTTNIATKSGGTVTTNYVDTALKNLKELYQKIGDVKGVADIDDIIKQAGTEGLTKLDVNNISRLYNQEFGAKAFSKIGEPLTSVNAQAYENIRSGLKDVARSGMGGTEAAAKDQIISSMYNTRKLIAANVEKVNVLQQKIANMGLLESIGHKVSKYADILSGGSIRGFIGGMLPRGAGYKVMNALDLEARLEANLKLINQAIQAGDKATVISLVDKLDNPIKLTVQTLEGASDDIVNITKGPVDDIVEKKGMFDLPNKQGGFIDFGTKFGKRPIETIAKNIDANDAKIMRQYLANPSNPKASMAMTKLAEDIGIPKTDFSGMKRVVNEILVESKYGVEKALTINSVLDDAAQKLGYTADDLLKPGGIAYNGTGGFRSTLSQSSGIAGKGMYLGTRDVALGYAQDAGVTTGSVIGYEIPKNFKILDYSKVDYSELPIWKDALKAGYDGVKEGKHLIDFVNKKGYDALRFMDSGDAEMVVHPSAIKYLKPIK